MSSLIDFMVTAAAFVFIISVVVLMMWVALYVFSYGLFYLLALFM